MRQKIKSIAIILLACCMVTFLAMPFQVRAEKRTVRVGFFERSGFYEYDELGEPCGYGVDYLKQVAGEAGWNYKLVKADSWEECVELLREGKIDILAPAQITPEREEEFSFCTFPIGTEYGALLH